MPRGQVLRRWAAGLLAALAVCAIPGGRGALTDEELLSQPIKLPQPTAVEKYISRKVADLISVSHYAKHSIDAEYSKQWYEEYFRLLDPARLFFLQSDLEDFRSYEGILGDLVMRRGNIDFAFEVYQRYLTRVREWTAAAIGQAAGGVDLSVDESILADRRQEPWLANREAQADLWRRHFKNRLLLEILQDEKRAAKAEAPDAGEDANRPPEGEHREEQTRQAPEKDPAGGRAPLPAPALLPRQGTLPIPTLAPVPNPAPAALPQPVPAPESASLPLPTPPERTPAERVVESYKRLLRRKLETDSIEIVEAFLSALTRTYDPHSAYMAPETQEDFDISMSLSLEGIGAVLTTKDAYVEVVEIVPGGPAARDGRLKPGDRIVAVAQGSEGGSPVDVVDMNLRKVVRLIRGAKGTTVQLTVLEAGNSMPTQIDIVRDTVELKAQEAKSELRRVPLPGTAGQEARVAVIDLPSFYCDFGAKRDGAEDYRSCSRDVARLIGEASREPLDGMILDLRGNGGGALEEAVLLAGLFFDSGPVVQVRDFRGRVQKREDTDGKTVYGGPLVVLVDRLSASASEIVAAALQDHRRAVIVGEASTHGKGTVQTVYSLDRLLTRTNLFDGEPGGSLKFTIQKFYRVNGGSTQVRGVIPDIVLPSFTDHMELGEAHLPHVLPWDEIEPLDITGATDVSAWLPELRERSEARRRENPSFVSRSEDIGRYGERRALKTVPLALEARRQFQRAEEEWAKEMREHMGRRRQDGPGLDDEHTDEDGPDGDPGEDTAGAGAAAAARDLVLEETMQVLTDLVLLTRNGGPATAGAAVAPLPDGRGEVPPGVEPATGQGEAARP
ncbi:MAG: carboxy terminal-processing peptidase [Lentisphaeria bacterium]|nr:carboxy terminal-processing peptidase [Lentisphaeria bacterium]